MSAVNFTKKELVLSEELLKIAGRSCTDAYAARRHAKVLAAAVPAMPKEQAKLARKRLKELETKFGPLLPDSEDPLKSPGLSELADWLHNRQHQHRVLAVLLESSIELIQGETNLGLVQARAYARTEEVLLPVGYNQFKNWMTRLRIAKMEGPGQYVPGKMAWVLVNVAMGFDPSIEGKVAQTVTAACLKSGGKNKMHAALWSEVRPLLEKKMDQ